MARRRGDLTGTSLDNKSSGSDIIGNDSPGMDVKTYQGMLIELGYLPPGSADGVKGDKTKAAIRKFQTEHPPLSVDGDVGPKTFAAMSAAVTAKRAAQTQTQQVDPTRPQQTPGTLPGTYDPSNVQRMFDMPTGYPTSVTIPGIGTVAVPGATPVPGVSTVPGTTQVSIPGIGVVSVPTSVPVPSGVGTVVPGTPGTPGLPIGMPTPANLPGLPAPQQQAQPEPKKEEEKILGMPKNVAIGGGIALGVLAIFGIYMMTRKSDSRSESAGGYDRYTDEDGRKWLVDPSGVAYPAGMTSGDSDSLAERVRRLHAAPRHRRMH